MFLAIFNGTVLKADEAKDGDDKISFLDGNDDITECKTLFQVSFLNGLI